MNKDQDKSIEGPKCFLIIISKNLSWNKGEE